EPDDPRGTRRPGVDQRGERIAGLAATECVDIDRNVLGGQRDGERGARDRAAVVKDEPAAAEDERVGIPDDLVGDAFLREDQLEPPGRLPEQQRQGGGYGRVESIHAAPPGARAAQSTNSRVAGNDENGNRPAS